jgi:predicted nucleic acid-binding protein
MEEMETLLDTDILVDLLRGNEEIAQNIDLLEDEGTLLSTSTLNTFELYYGAYKTINQSENILAARRLLDRLIIHELDLAASERAGELQANLEKEGTPLEFRDTLIASIVLNKDISLYTRNTRHFQKIPELELRAFKASTKK